MRQLYSALDYMHNDIEIAHFDVKPANILISESGYVRLTDVQLSKPAKERVRISEEGTLQYVVFIKGNIVPMKMNHCYDNRYLAPECFNQDRHNACNIIPTYCEVDMWAAGIVCYQLLFHEHPILTLSTSDRRKARQHLIQFNGQLLFPEDDRCRECVPQWLKQFLTLSLSPNGRHRPTSAEAFRLFCENAMM